MVGKRRTLLYLVAFLGLLFSNSQASRTWEPHGTYCGDGYAYGPGGIYTGGDIIDHTNSFATVVSANKHDNTLYWDCHLNGTPDACMVPLKINGNVTIEALAADGLIKTRSPVTFRQATRPPLDHPSTVHFDGYAHLQFHVAAGKKLEVHVDHDIRFEGFNSGHKSDPKPHDIILSFRGRGQTIFRYADGTGIQWLGELDKSHRVNVLGGNTFDGFSNHGGGTKVFITMEQTQADIDAGIDKLVFQRNGYRDDHLRVINVVGLNSIVTYVSTDVTGNEYKIDPSSGGFASIASDVSNKGSGRNIWFIMGAFELGSETGDYTPDDPEYNEIEYVYPFNDGAIVVAGHKVDNYSPDGIRNTLNYSIPAGAQATFKVTDNVEYNHRSSSNPYNPTREDSRGLLVVNNAQSVSKRASDPYLDFFNTEDAMLGLHSNNEFLKKPIELVKRKIKAITQVRRDASDIIEGATAHQRSHNVCSGESANGYHWSYSWGMDHIKNTRNVRTGFVLGINGLLDVYHNTFFDYVAGSINKVDLLAKCDYSSAHIKQKNPAAFIADGLDTILYSMGMSQYEAGDPLTQLHPRTASITLRGLGKAYFRCSASQKFMYIYNLINNLQRFDGEELIDNFGEEIDEFGPEIRVTELPDFDWDGALIVADSVFDGCRLDPKSVHLKKCGEGNHVVEVEGKLVVTSVSNFTIIDPKTGESRDYLNEYIDAGVINMPTIAIDFTGRELADRPLILGDSYLQYNSPALFFNNNVSFFNTNIVHSDLTKRQQLVPTTADPAHTGGERFFFANELFIFDGSDRDRYRWPEVQLYNSTIDLWESLTSAGIRYVVKDIPGKRFAPEGSNKSIIRFFDHGDVSDTLFKCHGRVFMLGSLLNTMADGSTNWVVQSCYVNVFKDNKPPVDPDEKASKVLLSLEDGNQFPSTVSADDYAAQRAIKPIVCSILPCGSANIAIGWQALEGDSSGKGYPYGNSTYYNEAIIEKRSKNQDNLFSLDALVVPAACISIDGSYMAFTAYSSCGQGIKNPICTFDASGVVYVLHGGRIRMAGPNCDEPRDLPFTTILSTIIANLVWNDYNLAGTRRVTELTGRVDIPQDQLEIDENGAIQPFGFTDRMFDARATQTDGLVRLSYYNQQRLCQIDKSSGEELVFNWCNRNGNNTITDPGVYPTFRSPANITRMNSMRAQGVTRATQSIGTPIDRSVSYPHLLYIGKGDDIKQIRVAGATVVDPFLLDVRGGTVREFIALHGGCYSPVTNPVGVGDHAILFVEECGQIGLGQRNWNQHSNIDPWSVLGRDHVRIIPLGDGTVFLNSNLIVSDRQALIASTQFAETNIQRLSFYSEEPNEIRIPAYGELDLSSFGQSEYRQEIEFGGNTKLVFEKGATIRFPSNPIGGVVLYFNDCSQLIFEQSDCNKHHQTLEAAELDKIKIKGIGQIWGNKNAQIQMNGNVAVAVCSDDYTPNTDITISLQGQSQWNIGTNLLSGGSFEVGNVAREDEIGIDDDGDEQEGEPLFKTVAFSFIANGSGAGWTIERNGLVGFGAGLIYKNEHALNGDANRSNNPVINVATGLALLDINGFPLFTPDLLDGTTIASLANVTNITIELKEGFLHHNNIADGSNRHSTVMLIGPVSESYTLSLNAFDQANLRGGGNLFFVPVNINNPIGTMFNVNIWDYAGVNADRSEYSIMAQSLMVLDGTGLNFASVPFGNAPGATFTTNHYNFFRLLAQQPVSAQLRPRASLDGLDDGDDTVIGYVNSNIVDPVAVYLPAYPRIIRDESAMIIGGNSLEVRDSGVVAVRGEMGSNPQYFSVIPAGN